MNEERRKTPRIDIEPDIRPEMVISDRNFQRIPLNLVDISRSGAGFLCKEQFDIGDDVRITLLLPGTDRRIVSHGTVRHREEFSGIFGYGVEMELAEDESRAIADYIVLAITKV